MSGRSLLAESRAFLGFARGLPAFTRRRITPVEARAVLVERLRRREEHFLGTLERSVFGHARSPYLPLLRAAGCELGDVRELVSSRGLEGALRALREAGVYVSFDEFKGRRAIERNGVSVPVRADDFDNPWLRRAYGASTGGSTGRPRRVLMDLAHFESRMAQNAVLTAAHGFDRLRFAQWAEIPPAHGLEAALLGVTYGAVPERWFTPTWSGRDGPGVRFRLATRVLVGVARAAGARVPVPEHVPLDRAEVIIRWAEGVLRTDGRCGIRAHVSNALRLAVAAHELGVDLTGVTIASGGEPPTPAKVAAIRATGASFVANYFFMEAGPVGYGCFGAEDASDTHLAQDHLALLPFRRAVPGFDVEVDAFHFTTLLPTAPKVMLNVESDDYGMVEERRCGCALDELGFHTHLRDVRSFGKLTGEGVTLVGSDMERILDEDLPRRFGGSPLDYQLVEEEDAGGFTKLTLLVDPAVEIESEDEVIGVVFAALHRRGGSAAVSGAIWRQAATLRMRRERPHATARGKHLPLRDLRPVGADAVGGSE